LQFNIRKLPLIFLVTLLISVSCSTKDEYSKPCEQVLNRYLEFSKYTDPGEFEYLYNNLPESIEEICDLVKKQLIHPFDIEKFSNKIPKDRVYEDRSIPNVKQMLKELLVRDSNGLVSSRQPENRLVVACVHHSLLLASILRHKGIPVRLRAGNAKYIGKDKRVRVTHAICEVWDTRRNAWFLVDPDRHKIDLDPQEFEFACETWYKIRNGNIEKKYYISRYKSVDQAAAHLVWLDLSYVISAEEPYWNDPLIVTKINDSINDISNNELLLLDNIAALLKNPDNHLDELVSIKISNNSLNPNGDS
jgi:hypothetical protein